MEKQLYTLGIDIGSTTVKIAILDEAKQLIFLIIEGISPISAKHCGIFSKKPMRSTEISQYLP